MRCCLSFLSTAAAILLATTASADIINMRCKGPLHEYQLKYDDETYKLVQIFDRIETHFILEEMKKDKAIVTTSGVVRNNGYDYKFIFTDPPSLTYTFANGSKQTEACWILKN